MKRTIRWNENVTFVLFLVLGSVMDSENRTGIVVIVLALLYQLYRMGHACGKEGL